MAAFFRLTRDLNMIKIVLKEELNPLEKIIVKMDEKVTVLDGKVGELDGFDMDFLI